MPVRNPVAFSSRGYRSQEYPNVLEIPSAYSAPTRGDVVSRVDGSSYSCDCHPRSQGPGPQSGPQNPYALPGPQSLGEPQKPQKPFQTPNNDPCQMNDEVMRGLGLDPDCMKGKRSAPKRAKKKAKAKTKTRSKAKPLKKRRSKTKLTTKQLFPKASGKPPNAAKFRTLANGACYDVVNRKFVKKAQCQ